jgi:hypothetical protein
MDFLGAGAGSTMAPRPAVQRLLGSGYVIEQPRPGLTLFKLVVLLPAVALTTASWLLLLMLACHAAGIHAGAGLFSGVGFVIAGISGTVLALIMGRAQDPA